MALMSTIQSGYRSVDTVDRPADYIARLDLVGAIPFWRDVKRRMLDELDIRPGDRALDIGSGPGNDALDMADRTGPGGLTVGVDLSFTMLQEASKRGGRQLNPLQWSQANGAWLPFRGGVFDACRIERVLQHVDKPIQVLREAARVTRAGGRIAAVEPDYGSVKIDGGDEGVTARIIDARCRHFASGRIGLILPPLLTQAGYRRVATTILEYSSATVSDNATGSLIDRYVASAIDARVITNYEGCQWIKSLEAAQKFGRYRYSCLVFLVSGVKA